MRDFLIGAASSAYQTEGNNIYSDCWVQENVRHSSYVEKSGACVDHYHHYEEDIALLKKGGGNAYRFSIEWARIEPEKGKWNEKEVEHYRKVLMCCRENGIEPVVTLMHFSSPAWVIREGGWTSPDVIDSFGEYVKYITDALGDLMHVVCTINEANMGFQLQRIAADVMKSNGKEGAVQVGVSMNLKNLLLGMLEEGRAFHCNPLHVNTFLKPRKAEQEKIVMRAHRKAVSVIHEKHPQLKTGLTLSLYDYQPEKGGEELAEKLWHDDFVQYLPWIQNDDFIGVQNYTRKIVTSEGTLDCPDGAERTQMNYENYPGSIGHVLEHVHAYYGGELIVTENGIAADDDEKRCAFMKKAFQSVLEAKKKGVPVNGYFYWSLLDNFEWQSGFGKKFGLIGVDRNTMERHPKPSLDVLKDLAEMEENSEK